MTDITPTDHNVEVNGLNIHYLDWEGHRAGTCCWCMDRAGTLTTGTTSPARCTRSSG